MDFELELNKEVTGWILKLKKGEELYCLYCGTPIYDRFYFCKQRERALCTICNKGEWQSLCRPTDNHPEHEHFNILETQWS